MAGAKKNPGRQQSIYTAARLASDGAAVFVDDCERDNERYFAGLFLGPSVRSVGRSECVGVDHVSGKAKSIAANRRCEYHAPFGIRSGSAAPARSGAALSRRPGTEVGWAGGGGVANGVAR